MSPRTRRIVIPLLVSAAAIAVVLVVFSSGTKNAPPATTPPAAATAGTPAGETPDAVTPDAVTPAAADETAGAATATVDAESTRDAIDGLRAVAPEIDGGDNAWDPIGSFDPAVDKLHLTFSPTGAGIETITLSDEWQTARARRQAEAHFAAVARGSASPPPLPPDDDRYVLSSPLPLRPDVMIPALAAQGVTINGSKPIFLLWSDEKEDRAPVWAALSPGVFQTLIVGEDDRPVLRITRAFTLGAGRDITLRQSIENLTDEPVDVRWYQYGPSDLTQDRVRYIDRRRFRIGHLLPQDPTGMIVDADKRLLVERMDLWKDKFQTEPIWPNEAGTSRGYELSWFSSTNRYFTITVHPVLEPLDTASRSLAPVVEKITSTVVGPKIGDDSFAFSRLYSPLVTVEPGATASLDMGIYAGPMDPRIIDNVEPYKSLNMRLLVLYQMSSVACCAMCTFQWLAHILIGFLSLCHTVLGDWGLAIIVLVCVVRAILHPLTKRAQINMQTFSKRMGNLKPEMDKLQKKFGDDAKRMQTEQLRLMREHGINPMQFLGCLPMFLQTPIWIALYAMLYFAFQIRQQPAFYGIFQKISGNAWQFLGDLSSPDRFITLFNEPKLFTFLFFAFDYSSINVLPLLMGVLFYLQQKYMTPPPNASMSKEQIKQQKVMRVLMVVMMPIVLYAAPSGLTLYILTSSSIAILEGRYVRKHIEELTANEGEDGPTGKKPAKKKRNDAMGRAYAAAMARAEQKRKAKSEPKKTFKRKKKR